MKIIFGTFCRYDRVQTFHKVCVRLGNIKVVCGGSDKVNNPLNLSKDIPPKTILFESKIVIDSKLEKEEN